MTEIKDKVVSELAVFVAVGSFTVFTDLGVPCNFVKGKLVTKSKAKVKFLRSGIESQELDYITEIELTTEEEETQAPQGSASSVVTGVAAAVGRKVQSTS